MMYLRPTYETPTVGFVQVYDPDTQLLVAADSIVVTVRLASSFNTSVTGTFTADATDITGIYKITIADVTDLTPCVHYYWRATVTVGTRVDVATGEFALGPPVAGGIVVADAGNTATTFKVAGLFADGSLTLSDPNVNNNFDGSLIALHVAVFSGSRIRKVVDYDWTTGFITVDEAFSVTPADDTPFTLITN